MNRRLRQFWLTSVMLIAGSFSFAAACGWMETASCDLHFHCGSAKQAARPHSSSNAPASSEVCYSDNPTQKPPESFKVEAPAVAPIAPTPVVSLPEVPDNDSSWALPTDDRPKSPLPLALSHALRAPPIFV